MACMKLWSWILEGIVCIFRTSSGNFCPLDASFLTRVYMFIVLLLLSP